MASSEESRSQLNAAADAAGARVAQGDVTDLTDEHIQVLRLAGIPDTTIAQLLREAGMEEEEVAGFALSSSTGTSTGIIVQTICVGTCPRATIDISFTGPCGTVVK